MSFKQTQINERLRKDINHHDSHHTMDIQCSKYIKIDSNIYDFNRSLRQTKLKTEKMNLIGFYDKDERMNQALNFIYVNEKQVSRENQRDLIFKLKFLQTQQHLAIKGRFQEIMRKFHSLLELDMAGFDPKLTKKLNQIKNRELREIQTEKVKRYIMMHACIIMRKLILRKRIKSLKTMNEKYNNPR